MPDKEEQELRLDHALWFGRMCLEHSPSTGGQISQPSSKKQSVSQSQKLPIFQYLATDGLLPEPSWEEDGQLLGEFWTLSTGESPSVAVESRLSQILEANPHQKYCLSPKAKLGILRRANRRGKEIPYILRSALQIDFRGDTYGQTQITNSGKVLLILWEKAGTENFVEWLRGVASFLQSEKILLCGLCEQKSSGNQIEQSCHIGEREQKKSEKCCTECPVRLLWERGLYGSTSQGQESDEQFIRQLGKIMQELSRQTAPCKTLLRCLWDACERSQSMQQALAGVESELEAWMGYRIHIDDKGSVGEAVPFGICSYESNAMKSDNPNSGIYEADTSRTLDNNGGNPACNQGGIAVVCLNDQGGSVMEVSNDVTGTIRAQEHGHQPIAVYENHAQGSRYGEVGDTAPTCTARYGTGGGNTPIVVSIGNGQMDNMSMSETANTLDCMHDQQAVMISFDRQRQGMYGESGVGSTLTAHEGKEGNDIVVTAVDFRNGTEDASTNGTLQAKSNGGTSLNLNNICRTGYTARRLTPTECERLQGFPDGWTDIGEWTDSTGKKRICSDSARYKALGNSIAIPPWLWVCDQIGQYLGEDKTMASLFDGIGGFPLIWSYLYGKENILWASEIEEFPIAVTKANFPDKDVEE